MMAAFLAVASVIGGAGPMDDAHAAEAPIRVVVWDEQQPSQKEAYDNFLGNCIADHLRAQPGFEVRSLSIKDAELGLSTEILDFAEVMFWWGHVRQADVKPEVGKAIVERVKAGRLTLVALHSAHWSTPFIEAMNERARLDLRRQWADLPPGGLSSCFRAGMKTLVARKTMRTTAMGVTEPAPNAMVR
jgi:hypothetical protein